MPVPLETLWAWHTRPGALERLMPPWDAVRVVARTGGLENGTRVTLAVPFGPLRLRWVSEHRDVDPPHGFADEQIAGPFARWVHVHAMQADGPAASILEDRIEYAGPAGPVGRAVARRAVAARLPALLRYRHETLAADLAAHARVADRPRLTVGITGASGLVGTALTHFLTSGGHRVVRFVRGTAARRARRRRLGSAARLPVAGSAPRARRRDPSRRRRRRRPALDAAAHGADPRQPRAGHGDAGPRPRRPAPSAAHAALRLGDRLLRVRGPGAGRRDGADGRRLPGRRSADDGRRPRIRPAPPALRVAHLRLGLVLSPAGGMLKTLLPVFRAGAGGVVGPGTQGMSWVGLDDVVGAFHHALFDDTLAGPVNVTAPEPVSNAAFTQALGRALHRPTLVPAPAFGLRLLLGRQMADETALSSAWVRPARLEATGYPFRHRTLDAALAHYLP